ncbi:MAG: hypothetical protein FWE47_00770 [Oscillospiraceae bacterium]|nr:hypothetical protein [Oscillospiraceae bacterium]
MEKKSLSIKIMPALGFVAGAVAFGKMGAAGAMGFSGMGGMALFGGLGGFASMYFAMAVDGVFGFLYKRMPKPDFHQAKAIYNRTRDDRPLRRATWYSLNLHIARLFLPIATFFLAGKPIAQKIDETIKNYDSKQKIEKSEEKNSLRESLNKTTKDTLIIDDVYTIPR